MYIQTKRTALAFNQNPPLKDSDYKLCVSVYSVRDIKDPFRVDVKPPFLGVVIDSSWLSIFPTCQVLVVCVHRFPATGGIQRCFIR